MQYAGKKYDYVPTAGKCKFTKIAHLKSSYELALAIMLDKAKHVIEWEYEYIKIGYNYAGKHHHYVMDFNILLDNGQKYLLEVKPMTMYITALQARTADMNYCKWQAAKNFATNHNYNFKVITERGLQQLGRAWT